MCSRIQKLTVVLASASPRRTELLEQGNIKHVVMPSHCEEVITSQVPSQVVEELSVQKAEELKDNPFDLIGKQWMLITAGNEEKCNTMTASWGGVGIMWGKPTATAYIRDSRYTKEFVDREDYFTLAFFGEEHREALNLCGRVSGRDEDKIKEAGLTPYYVDGTVAFEEAKMIFVCKKVYVQRMGEENFVEKENLDKWYADKDMHNMYMGEIKKILVQED